MHSQKGNREPKMFPIDFWQYCTHTHTPISWYEFNATVWHLTGKINWHNRNRERYLTKLEKKNWVNTTQMLRAYGRAGWLVATHLSHSWSFRPEEGSSRVNADSLCPVLTLPWGAGVMDLAGNLRRFNRACSAQLCPVSWWEWGSKSKSAFSAVFPRLPYYRSHSFQFRAQSSDIFGSHTKPCILTLPF